ncbi:hypothetical protein VTJ04DRAFT_2675 [Mycothermus thermophilus]|uniref:uncharacterized protein n=1 Tax=Humicola insolens TaxID=85995 RepID=UPI003742F0A4
MLGCSTLYRNHETNPFELDITYPDNNLSCNQTDVLPIVFAVHNVTNLHSLGLSVTLEWNLHPTVFSTGYTLYGYSVDNGSFAIPDPSTLQDPSAPLFLVAATNVTSWIHEIKNPRDWVTIQWRIRVSGCGEPDIVARSDKYHAFLPVPPKWDETNPTCAVANELLDVDQYTLKLLPLDVLGITQACAIRIDGEKAKSLNSQATAYLTVGGDDDVAIANGNGSNGDPCCHNLVASPPVQFADGDSGPLLHMIHSCQQLVG